MGWFESLCRNLGLMIHNIRHPDAAERKVTKHEVEEKREGNVVLRRTTIEEIEIRKTDRDDQ